MQTEATLTVGQRVRTWGSWGEGELIEIKPKGAKVPAGKNGRMVAAKPYVVRREDGKVGYFNVGQIEAI